MTKVITYGTFDLLHPGHIKLLKRAKEHGDYLVVGLSTDEFNAQKGKNAYYSYQDRKEMLEALSFVDLVIPENNWEQKRSDISEYQIDELVMGNDWEGKFDDLKDITAVTYLPRTPEISTTEIKNRLANIRPSLEKIKTALVDGVFEFINNLDPKPITSKMIFKADGTIDFGKTTSNENFWEIDNTVLNILGKDKEIKTVFNVADAEFEGPLLNIRGRFLPDEKVEHLLRQRSNSEFLVTQEKPFTASDFQNVLTDFSNKYEANKLDESYLLKKHRKIRVAFILNAVETVASTLSLIQRMGDDDRFEMRVIAVDRWFSTVRQPGTNKKVADFLNRLEIPHLNLDYTPEYIYNHLREWQPDVVFRQSEWDGDFNPLFALKNLSWTRVAIIPYVITENFIKGIHDNFLEIDPVYEDVWKYFVAFPLSNEEKQELQKTFISQETYQPVGSIKAIEIWHTKPKWPKNTFLKKIIWMAHHSVGDDWFKFGAFLEVKDLMLKMATDNQNASFIFNPHPSLRAVIRARRGGFTFTEKEYDDFLDKWNSLPNTNTIVNENSYPAMAAADLVLTDGVSSLYEAQIFKKPIVYYERAGHTKFTQLGEKWMRGVHTVSKLDDLVPTIEKLLFGKNDLEAIEEENFKQLTKGFPTQAILDFIVKDLRKGKFNS